ncbi:MAG: hypothetical protein P4L22_03315 [Candidatus Babeliales bacterium]|nr:hypothetical protein [Candidatus Babeliales bacterium]
MKTISIKAFFLAFAVLISPTPSIARCSTDTKILIAGGLLAGGLIFYKLSKNGYFAKSEDLVINDALAAINSGIKLSEVSILDNHYKILSLTDSERRNKIDSISEGILYQLISAVSRYSYSDAYVSNINAIISNIKDSKKELKDCLKRQCLKEYDINNLLNSIENLLPKIEFLYAYTNTHRGYFNLSMLVKQLDSDYQREMELVSSPRISYQDFKWIVRNAGCKINPKYPFISYVNKLKEKNNQLHNTISNVAYRYPNLLSYAQNIQNKLNLILDNAIADQEYSKETKERDAENRKKEELALKEREFKLKQQMELEKLALKQRETEAREREVQAREREAAARELAAKTIEYELYLKQFKPRR